MIKTRAKGARPLHALFALPLLLAGCGPLISLGDDGPAAEVYSLRYQGGFHDSRSAGRVVYVDEPILSDGLGGEQVSVLLDGTRRTTLDGVKWSDPLSELVRDYITRSLGHRSGVHLVGEGGLDIKAACRLGSKVWAFELLPGDRPGKDAVSVAIELSLVRLSDSTLVSHPTISKTVAVDGGDNAAVMAAFNLAMSQIAADMTTWFGASVDSCNP